MCVGKCEKRPYIKEDDSVGARKESSIVMTGDDRFGDAAAYMKFYKCFIGYS